MKPYILAFRNLIRINLKKLRCRKIQAGPVLLLSCNSKLVFHPSAEVIIDNHFINDGHMSIFVDEGASLKIGKSVYFNEDGYISCKKMITIGDRCNFGPGVKIFDNNHKYNAKDGLIAGHNCDEIVIGENTWIGANVVILKGAKIGKNCVIGAGCIIDSEIPDACIVKQNRDLIIDYLK